MLATRLNSFLRLFLMRFRGHYVQRESAQKCHRVKRCSEQEALIDFDNKNLANPIPRESNTCRFSRLEGRERSTMFEVTWRRS